jgi:3'-5' exonuclease
MIRHSKAMNVLAFDIETVPDVESGRRLYALEGLSDADIAQVMFEKRREETSGDSEFLRHHLQKVAAISIVLRHSDSLRVWSLGDTDSGEAELIRRFFDGIEKFTPTLVSWNGSQFDLPVLHYRALVHGIACPRYWDTGEGDREFRWNNYLNRYHERHTDLMDVLAAYQPRAAASLHDLALILGLPGKLGMSGADVWGCYCDGGIAQIRDYCEIDALNTYLIFLRWELLRGNLDNARWLKEQQLVRDTLKNDGRSHLRAFLAEWDGHTRTATT